MPTFVGEEALKAKNNCTLSNHLFNYAVNELNYHNHDGGVAAAFLRRN